MHKIKNIREYLHKYKCLLFEEAFLLLRGKYFNSIRPSSLRRKRRKAFSTLPMKY